MATIVEDGDVIADRASLPKHRIATSRVNSDHRAVQSPGESTAKVVRRVNTHTFVSATDQRFPGWLCALIYIAGIVLTWAAIVYAVVWALSASPGLTQ